MQTLFHCRDQEDAEYYARLVGHNTVQSKTKSRSFGKGTSRSVNVSAQKRDLLNPDEFKTLPMEKCVVTITNSFPIFADKIMYYKEEIFDGLINKEPSEVPSLLSFIPNRLHQKESTNKTLDLNNEEVIKQIENRGEWDNYLDDEQPPLFDEYGNAVAEYQPNKTPSVIDDDEVTADAADDYVSSMVQHLFADTGIGRLWEILSLHNLIEEQLSEDGRALIEQFAG